MGSSCESQEASMLIRGEAGMAATTGARSVPSRDVRLDNCAEWQLEQIVAAWGQALS